MKLILMSVFVMFFAAQIHAQKAFRMNDAAKAVDVLIDVGKCDDGDVGLCGPVKVSFFRKGAAKPFQDIRLAQTQLWDPVPQANVINRYDDQSIINFTDFNFDGVEDLAICDGTNGGYGMPSYKIYLYSKTSKRFVYSPQFTAINEGGLGMFETDPKKKMHYVYSKSGCCWHQTQGFDVFRGRPRKVYEATDDATGVKYIKTTVKKLVKGKWRTTVTREKRTNEQEP